jgi:hypothetical protein
MCALGDDDTQANNKTFDECIQRRLFGLTDKQWTRAQNFVKAGQTALFLYNYEAQEVSGLFLATEVRFFFSFTHTHTVSKCQSADY